MMVSAKNCPVCFDDIDNDNGVDTLCGHTFHRKCIRVWLDTHTTCPMCRTHIANTHPPIEPVFEQVFDVIDVYDDVRMYAPTGIVMYEEHETLMDGNVSGSSDDDVSVDDDPDYILSDCDSDDE